MAGPGGGSKQRDVTRRAGRRSVRPLLCPPARRSATLPAVRAIAAAPFRSLHCSALPAPRGRPNPDRSSALQYTRAGRLHKASAHWGGSLPCRLLPPACMQSLYLHACGIACYSARATYRSIDQSIKPRCRPCPVLQRGSPARGAGALLSPDVSRLLASYKGAGLNK